MTHLDRVWPPTLVGKRREDYIDPYVHDSDAEAELTLPKRAIQGHPNAVWMKQICIKSVKCDECPVYVFPPSAEGFPRATYVDCHMENEMSVGSFPKLCDDGWTLRYATVEDMAAIDPHRKLVDWISMDASKDINKDDVPINMIASPHCLSAAQEEEFQAKLRDLDAAQDVGDVESEAFESNLKSILVDEVSVNLIFKNACAFDGVRVANASFERLSSFGMLMGEEREHAANAFTSRLIHGGTERELETLQKTTNEILRARATKRQLTQLELDDLESTRVLVKKQNMEMIQHLVELVTRSEVIVEEAMLSRVKLVTTLRETEEKACSLQKLISSGATKIHMIGTLQCLPTVQKEGFQAKLRSLENMEEDEEFMEVTPKWKLILVS